MSINLLTALTDNIRIDKDKCTFCGTCVETCILDNLRMKLAPCRQACPLGVNSQGYIQLIARGQEQKALDLIHQTLPFPGIIGRICSQPCEEMCHRNIKTGSPVAIRALKRYLADTGLSPEPSIHRPGPDTGFKVAIIGTGPAGILAAHDLRMNGHGVTMFESEIEPGGMLRWAIPEFRLPAAIVREEVALLEKMGVEIRCGVTVEKDIPFMEIREDFDAVIIAAGCQLPVTIGVDYDGVEGIFYGLPFLRGVKSGRITGTGSSTVVIGGGNSAVDAAQTALRLGADRVTMISIEKENELPAFPWTLEEAVKEGVIMEHSWGPVSFRSDSGAVAGIEFQRCVSVYDENGRFRPCYDSCETKDIEADAVIIAAGQCSGGILSEITGNNAGREITVDPLTLQIGESSIFAAGDAVTGPSSAINAMAQGRRAAVSVDRLLKGEHLGYGRAYEGPVELEFEIETEGFPDHERAVIPVRAFSVKGDFMEKEQALDRQSAIKEAERCYSCGSPFGKFRTCWFCLPCEVECPEEALSVEIPYLLR